MGRGLARSTVMRALATLRSLLAFAVADGRVAVNVAAAVKAPTGAQARREGQMLSMAEVEALAAACRGRYGELVMVLGLEGLRWGELAGLRVEDRVSVPGPGLRLSRAVLASNGGGALYLDSLKSRRARTVPLVGAVMPIVERWAEGKAPGDWLFLAPEGAGHCERRTGSGPWPGGRRCQPSAGPSCGYTICGTPRRRCGWGREPTRRWCSGGWDRSRRR